MGVLLKERPEDFLVTENFIGPRLSTTGRFDYFVLRKTGVTTFEAIEAIATELDLPPVRIHYAGLKDEDGISEQLIAIERSVEQTAIRQLNDRLRRGASVIELSGYGRGDEAIEIGALHGNSFRIIARNLAPTFVERAQSLNRLPVYFLNYYDSQRFGTPQGPKTTHRIGEALLRGAHDAALELVRTSRSSESARALAFRGDAAAFFIQLEPRVVNFYKSAHASHLWNEALAAEVRRVSGGDAYVEHRDELAFVMTPRQDQLLNLLASCPSLDYQRFYGKDGGSGTLAQRATVIQTQVICKRMAPDEARPGTYACELAFSLPAGCYATMFVRQLVDAADPET